MRVVRTHLSSLLFKPSMNFLKGCAFLAFSRAVLIGPVTVVLLNGDAFDPDAELAESVVPMVLSMVLVLVLTTGRAATLSAFGADTSLPTCTLTSQSHLEVWMVISVTSATQPLACSMEVRHSEP